jgi:hypothetical protein
MEMDNDAALPEAREKVLKEILTHIGFFKGIM